MRRALTFSLLSALAATAILASSCSDSETVGNQETGCTEYSAVGESPSCEGLCAVSNEAFCAGVATTPNCGDLPPGAAVDVCGVLMNKPEVGGELIELKRSPNVDEYAGSGPPDLACYREAGFPSAPGTPQLVTIEGIAKVFSNGCESNDVQIEVYTVTRDGSEASDGMPDQLVGTAAVTASDCTLDGVPEDNDNCTDPQYSDQRWECTYEYAEVPTETELLIKTFGSGWAPLYEYNVFVPNSEVVNGRWTKDVRALAQDDYQLIPQTAMGKTMEPGRGAIGGEVHDCGNVRLINAIVDSDKANVLTYFTDDEVKPLPDKDAQATSTLGLYSLLDVGPGVVNVAAAGVLNGELVGVGFFKARVFADSVSSVTFRGLRPFQLP